ncbi:hypothetical protein F4823DRAFT_619639, partial [Ustulina deusta]
MVGYFSLLLTPPLPAPFIFFFFFLICTYVHLCDLRGFQGISSILAHNHYFMFNDQQPETRRARRNNLDDRSLLPRYIHSFLIAQVRSHIARYYCELAEHNAESGRAWRGERTTTEQNCNMRLSALQLLKYIRGSFVL